MAILITEDGAVRYVNQNDVDRTMFPNLTGALGDEQYDALNGRLIVVEGKVSDLEDCCTEVSGDITEIENSLTQKADKTEVLSTYVVDTETGGIVSFPDGADDIPVKDLSVAIEPVQDLNGYDNPWPAGGGVNVWDEEVEGGVLTSDGTVTSSNSRLITKNYIPIVPGETYAVVIPYSGRGKGAFYDENHGFLSYFDNFPDSGQNAVFPNDGTIYQNGNMYYFTFIAPNGAYYVKYNIVSGYGTTYNHDISINYPSTEHSYSPYSNVCPISGWTGANISACGVNLWDEEWENGYISSSGEKISHLTNIVSKNYICIDPTATYYCTASNSVYVYLYDANYSPLGFVSGNVTNKTFTSPYENAKYMLFYCSSTETYSHDISINYPSTDHDYHAYNGSSISVNWQTEAGTVYGGTLNVTTGVLTVDRAYKLLNGVDDSVVTYRNNGHSTVTTRAYVTVANKAFGDANIISSEFYTVSSSADAVGIMTGRPASNGVEFYLDVSVPDTTDGVKAWFANNPTQLVYELATPQTYQLTPQEVSTILGQNNIFADTGNVTVQYRADTKLYIDKVLSA